MHTAITSRALREVYLSNLKVFLFIHFLEREQAGRGSERGRQNPKQAPCPQHRAQCRLEPTNHELPTEDSYWGNLERDSEPLAYGHCRFQGVEGLWSPFIKLSSHPWCTATVYKFYIKLVYNSKRSCLVSFINIGLFRIKSSSPNKFITQWFRGKKIHVFKFISFHVNLSLL